MDPGPSELPESPVPFSREADVPAPAAVEGEIERERTGLLIIRAWLEEGSSKPLRAQVRLTNDVSEGYQRTINLADSKDVCATVEGWLQDMMSDSESAE